MPVTKHSFARYQVIDACIRNKQRSYPGIEFLIERCSQRLDQKISRSTIEKDLKAMKDDPEPGYYAPIRYDRMKRGYYYEDPGYSISNILLKDEDIDAIDKTGAISIGYIFEQQNFDLGEWKSKLDAIVGAFRNRGD